MNLRLFVAFSILAPQLAVAQTQSNRIVVSVAAVPAFGIARELVPEYFSGMGAALSTRVAPLGIPLGFSTGLYRMQRAAWGGFQSRWVNIAYGTVQGEPRILSAGNAGLFFLGGVGGYHARSDIPPDHDYELRFGFHAGLALEVHRMRVDARAVRTAHASLMTLVPLSVGFAF